MADLTFTVKGGHWATGDQLRSRLEPALRPSVARAAYLLQGGIQRTTPVRTGALRRSWATSPPAWVGAVLKASVGTNLPYAEYQDTKTRNKGYIAAGVSAARPAVTQELGAGIAAAQKEAWIKE